MGPGGAGVGCDGVGPEVGSGALPMILLALGLIGTLVVISHNHFGNLKELHTLIR